LLVYIHILNLYLIFDQIALKTSFKIASKKVIEIVFIFVVQR
jgi:hypothetical protein